MEELPPLIAEVAVLVKVTILVAVVVNIPLVKVKVDVTDVAAERVTTLFEVDPVFAIVKLLTVAGKPVPVI